MKRLLILILFSSAFLISCAIKYPRTTIGTVHGDYQPASHGGHYNITYYVKGKKGFEQTSHNPYLSDGSKVLMTYDSIKPYWRSNVTYYPIFTMGEDTKKTTAIITKNKVRKHYSVLTYEYYDGNMSTKYKCWLVTRAPKSDIKVGDNIPIEYSIQKPKEAILLVDSLIKDTTSEGLIYRHY